MTPDRAAAQGAWSIDCSAVAVAVVTALIVAAVALFYRYSTGTYDTWRRAGVPCPQPVPLFGNTFGTIAGLERQVDVLDRIYRQFPDAAVCGYYQMRTPFLMVRDPRLINATIMRDFSHFTDRGLGIDPAVNLMARGLFFANGQKWRIMRQKLSPGFTSGKLKGAQGQIRECGDQLTDSVARRSAAAAAAAAASGGGDGGIDVTEAVENAAVDVIGTCAFGMKLDTISDDGSDFKAHVKKIVAPSGLHLLVSALGMLAPGVVRRLRLHSFHKGATDFFHSVFDDVLRYRTENEVVRNDLTQTLIEARKELVLNGDSAGGVEFCELDIVGNAILLFAAGSETVALTTSYCLYELALNKEIQNRLRAEIISVKEKYDGELNNDFLMDLHYADMVLNETHRKYSISGVLMREATQNYNIPEETLFIEKGQKVIIPMYSIHHDPKYYPNPETFDPERFTMEEKSKRPNCTFLPFGDGPRHCIGKRFAEMELKLILSKILLKFVVLPSDKTEIPIQMKVRPGLIVPKNGIWLKFREIQL